MNAAYRRLLRLRARHRYFGVENNGPAGPRGAPSRDFHFVALGDTAEQLRNHRILSKWDAAGLLLAYPSSDRATDSPIIPPTDLRLRFAIVLRNSALLNIIAGLPTPPDRLGSRLRWLKFGTGGVAISDKQVSPTSGPVAVMLPAGAQTATVEGRPEGGPAWTFLKQINKPPVAEDQTPSATTHLVPLDQFNEGLIEVRTSIDEAPATIETHFKGICPDRALAVIELATASTASAVQYDRSIDIEFPEAPVNVEYRVSIRRHGGMVPDPATGAYSLKELDTTRGLPTPVVTVEPGAAEVRLAFTLQGVRLRHAPFTDYQLVHIEQPGLPPSEERVVIPHLPGLRLDHFHPIVHVDI